MFEAATATGIQDADGVTLCHLRITNSTRIELVDIEISDGVTVVGGANAQGKTAIIRAWIGLVGGKRHLPAKPLREGTHEGEIHATLSNGWHIIRRFKRNARTEEVGTDVEVIDEKGFPIRSPQQVIDGLGARFFDPIAFASMKPADQARELEKAIFTQAQLDDRDRRRFQVEQLRAKRTEIGRDVKKAEGALANCAHFPDAPKEPLTADAVAEEQAKYQVAVSQQAKVRGDAERALDAARRASAAVDAQICEVQRLEGLLAQAKSKLCQLEGQASTALSEAEAAEAKAKALPPIEQIDFAARFREIEAVNSKVRANQTRALLDAEVTSLRAAYEARSREIEQAEKALDAEVATALANSPLASLRLSFDAGGVKAKGLPIEQASGAEQLTLAFAVLVASNPGLRFVAIDEGEKLDAASLKLLRDMALKARLRVLLTKVGTEGASVLMVNGCAIDTELAQAGMGIAA